MDKDFNQLSKPAKRVALAKDVIAQIKSEKYISTSGIYGKARDAWGDVIPLADFKSVGDNCTCCAKGALFISHFNIGGEKTEASKQISHLTTILLQSQLNAGMGDVFDREQWDLIECAFERSDFYGKVLGATVWNNNPELVEDAINFGAR